MGRINRREFIERVGSSLFLATGVNAIALLINFGSIYRYKPLTYQSKKIAEFQRGGGKEFLLRPPGARGEEDFLSKCIKCHLCVEACPIQAIKIAGREKGMAADTPYIIPEIRGCDLCLTREKMYCNQVCPTDALEKLEPDKELLFEKMKMGAPLNMGIAVLDKRICYPWTGVNACGWCWEACPYTYKGAIVPGDNRAVHPANAPNFYPENCVGCGLCVDVCPLPQRERAVKIVSAREIQEAKEFKQLTPEGRLQRWSFEEKEIPSRPRGEPSSPLPIPPDLLGF